MHGTRPFASRKPTCAGSPRILLFCYFTISVLYYSTTYYFTVNYSTILLFYHDPGRLHLGNRPAPVHPGFYYLTILLFQYCTILLCTILLLTIPLFAILPRPQPFASRKPTCAGSPRILLFYYYSTTTPAVCISETDLRRFTQDFTILLFQYCPILLCTILLLTIPLFTILPRPQPFASRKPTCAGSPGILLFYYFTTILPRPQPFASRKPTCAGSPKILLFYYFSTVLFYYVVFTVNYSTIYYSTTTPAVCISETDLRRFTQDFTILLFYYFSTVFYYVLFYC